MEIRRLLTYQFTAIVALILMFSLIAIYVSFSRSRLEEFNDRMSSKAKLVAQMLIEIDEIDLDLLKKIEKNNPLSLPNEKIVIYNYKNQVIYSSDEDKTLKISKKNINRVRLEEEIRLIQRPYEIVGHFYTGEYDRIVVFVGAVDIYGLNKLKRLKYILIIVYTVSLIIIYFTGRLFAARALNPISAIMSEVDRIEISNLNIRLNEGNGKDELARLARTFNRMLKRLETAFRIQKSFIANASHELRTPLTVITGQLEVSLLNERSNEEYKNTINSVFDEIKNINQLANRLLLLAQTSSDLSDFNFSSIRIDNALWQAQNELRKNKKDYSVTINFTRNIIDEEMLMIIGNDVLLKIALINLIDNSCKYSPDKKADVLVDFIDKNIIIKIEDQGIGIPKEDLKMIFNPFYRSINAMNEKGHGIGLSIVDRIINLHNGRIDVFSEQNNGTTFILRFPARD